MGSLWTRRSLAVTLAALGLSLPGVESYGSQMVARRVEIRVAFAAMSERAVSLAAPLGASPLPLSGQLVSGRNLDGPPVLKAPALDPGFPTGSPVPVAPAVVAPTALPQGALSAPPQAVETNPGDIRNAAPARAQPVYGPFHRLGVTVETLKKILASGELWGRPPRGIFASDIPAAKAFPGPLPPGERGFEFTTSVAPDDSGVGFLSGIKWTGPRPGVKVDPYSWAKIPVTVTKVSGILVAIPPASR